MVLNIAVQIWELLLIMILALMFPQLTVTERSQDYSSGEVLQLSKATKPASTFTPEEELKFNTQFEEGYNLYHPKYVE